MHLQRNGLVDSSQPTVQMTFEEVMPVEVEVVPEIDDTLVVDDVEPIGSSEQEEEPVVENSNPTAVSVFNFENHNVRTVVDESC